MKKRSLLAFTVIVGGVLAVAGSTAHAQDVLDQASRQADEIARQNAANEIEERLGTVSRVFRAPSSEQIGPRVWANPSGQEGCVNIHGISVSGVRLVSQKELKTAISGWEGKCIGLADINNVLEALTNLYMQQGYVAARAYILEQDLSLGMLQAEVVEGTLEDIRSSSGASRRQMATAFPGMIGRPVNLRDIEQGLDQINRLRSHSATIDLKAGVERGGSVLHVVMAKAEPWWASLSSNNLGSDTSGRTQSRADFGVENLIGVNDEWKFSYQRSMRGGPLSFSDERPNANGFEGSFSVPYGYWLFGLEGSWSDYRTQLKTMLGDLPTSGHSSSISAYATRVVHRDQISKTWVTGRLARKGSENFLMGDRIETSSRVSTVVTAEVGHSRRIAGGAATALLGLHRGIKVFGATVSEGVGSPDAGFSKLTAALSYSRPLKLSNLDLTMSSSLVGQWSDDVLSGWEQLALGGHSTIRGTREGLYFGRSGFYWRNEIAARLPAAEAPALKAFLGQLEPYVAIDIGRVWNGGNTEAGAGSMVGGAVGIRNAKGRLNFDFSYAKVLATSAVTSSVAPKDGVFLAKISIGF